MALVYKDRVKETTTTTGTGTLTLAGAVSGYQAFSAVGNANTCIYGLEASDGGWEVGIGTYTLSGTTLARTTVLASSNAGSAITLPAGTHNVYVTADASREQSSYEAHSAITPGGRLTLTTATPVTTADVTGATTVYYTPYVHDRIALWTGAYWKVVQFAETSHALGTVTSGKPYDVFVYLDAGALALEKLVWTDDTTRATAITLQDGRYCKSGDKTRLYLGTFYTTSTTATEDSKNKRYLFNMYNKENRSANSPVGTAHTYDTATLREWNNGSGTLPRTYFMLGLGNVISVFSQAFVNHTSTQNSTIRCYLDGSTDISETDMQFLSSAANMGAMIEGSDSAYAAEGHHYITIFEAEYGGGAASYGKGKTCLTGIKL